MYYRIVTDFYTSLTVLNLTHTHTHIHTHTHTHACLLQYFHLLNSTYLYTITAFLYPPHNSGGVLWFHVGPPCVCSSISHTSISLSVHISFPDDNLSKHQWIFTKLGMCIDIVEIGFGIATGLISSNFDRVICPRHTHVFISG